MGPGRPKSTAMDQQNFRIWKISIWSTRESGLQSHNSMSAFMLSSHFHNDPIWNRMCVFLPDGFLPSSLFFFSSFWKTRAACASLGSRCPVEEFLFIWGISILSDASEHDPPLPPPPPPPPGPPSAHAKPFQRGQEDKMNRGNVRLLLSGGGMWGGFETGSEEGGVGVGGAGGGEHEYASMFVWHGVTSDEGVGGGVGAAVVDYGAVSRLIQPSG